MNSSFHEGEPEFKNSNLERNNEGTEVLLAINLGCFHTQVLCNVTFSPLHCLSSLRSLESFHKMRSVSKLIIWIEKDHLGDWSPDKDCCY